MNYIASLHTDIGIKKLTNEDSVCLKVAKTSIGNIVFAVLCDGMGGLSKGELASATLIRAFEKWFRMELPGIIEKGYDTRIVKNRWSTIITEQNNIIVNYGKVEGVSLGTTLTALLIVEDTYLIVNVGDSRVYGLRDTINQITKDHTVVAREIERGNITAKQAQEDSRRNILLQCIGACNVVIPDFFEGKVIPGTAYLVCSDGFRHEITKTEIYDQLSPSSLTTQEDITIKIRALIDLIKERQEQDNITAVVIKVID